MNLWLFNHEEAVLNYRKSGARISKIHFNDSGSKFGYCDFGGVLSLWRFNSSPDGLHRPYVVRHNTMVIHRCCWYPNNLSLSLSQALQCHNKRAMDFAFLNAGSFISTAGISSDNYNVFFWDLRHTRHWCRRSTATRTVEPTRSCMLHAISCCSPVASRVKSVRRWR